MTYSELKYYCAKCDCCGKVLKKFFTNPDAVDNNAALYGWKKKGVKHICSECAVELAVNIKAVSL